MDGAAAHPPEPDRTAAPADLGRDLGLLAILLLLTLGVRAWVIGHTEVAARDSIGYIRYAWELEHRPWGDVLRGSRQHPGYPLVLLAVSWPVRHFTGVTDATTMRVSAQLASALASLLLVLPLYYLGKALFNRGAAFWATALFQCLPVSGRILSDGLSEATFLLFATSCLLFGVRGLHAGRVRSFALSGLFAGPAYLTRPEGLLLVAGVGLVLLAMQARAAWRRPWRQALACGTALTATAVLVGAPYAWVIGHVTIKTTGREILTTSAARPETPTLASAGPARVVPGCLLAVWSLSGDRGSLWWGFHAVLNETGKGFFYIAWLPALVGMYWFRSRLSDPGPWVLFAVCGLQVLVLWRLAAVAGYVSERHVLLLVLCGLYWSAATLLALGAWLAGRWRIPAATLLVLLLVGGLAGTLRPLHANRAGHHAAGLWLAAHAGPVDGIIDPFCWAHYYAGRIFCIGEEPVPPPGAPRTVYVVLEASGEEAPRKKKLLSRVFPALALERSDNHDHAREPLMDLARAVAAQGKVTYHWPTQQPLERAKILVYATAVRMPAHVD